MVSVLAKTILNVKGASTQRAGLPIIRQNNDLRTHYECLREDTCKALACNWVLACKRMLFLARTRDLSNVQHSGEKITIKHDSQKLMLNNLLLWSKRRSQLQLKWWERLFMLQNIPTWSLVAELTLNLARDLKPCLIQKVRFFKPHYIFFHLKVMWPSLFQVLWGEKVLITIDRNSQNSKWVVFSHAKVLKVQQVLQLW